ncbi:MAG: ATP-grasp domain-containing protein [bacterium]|nr:ATP-grasp domain-containing protein [bacterium]
MQKAIYIIGAGLLGKRMIDWAREAGAAVIVTDKNECAPGFSRADAHAVIDGTDKKGHLAFVKKLEKIYQIAGVYCGNEFGAWTVYELSRALGLEMNTKDAIHATLDKTVMKKMWEEAHIFTPMLLDAKSASQHEMIIVKPAVGSGSRGVSVVSGNEVESAVVYARNAVPENSEVVIEEYVEGRHIDANGVWLGGTFYPCGVLERFFTPLPDRLPMGGYDPANIPEEEKNIVYELLKKSSRALGITFGPVKGDFIRKPNGEYVVLEVAFRFHGDVSSVNNLPFGSNINPLKFYFHYIMTGDIHLSYIKPEKSRYAMWRVICAPPGIVKEIPDTKRGADEYIISVWLNERCAREIPRYRNNAYIPGLICAYGDTKQGAENALKRYFEGNAYSVIFNEKEKEWYRNLGGALRAHNFSLQACGYDESVL